MLLDVLVELGTAYLSLESVSTMLGLDDLESVVQKLIVNSPDWFKNAPPASDL